MVVLPAPDGAENMMSLPSLVIVLRKKKLKKLKGLKKEFGNT